MNRSKKRTALALCLVLSATPLLAEQRNEGPNIRNGFGDAARGLVVLVLTPVQITAGLLEGIASLPYFAASGLHTINEQLVETRARVTLDDTYDAAYGKRLKHVSEDGQTGETFRRMKHATTYFQRVLKQYGIRDYNHFFLVSNDNASDKGYTLFAVVYRPHNTIRVRDKQKPTAIREFSVEDRLFYEAYQLDAAGRPLDTIVDYAGLPLNNYNNQKMQAILLTLAANSVANFKRKPDYWQMDQLWNNGRHMEVIQASNRQMQKKLGIQ